MPINKLSKGLTKLNYILAGVAIGATILGGITYASKAKAQEVGPSVGYTLSIGKEGLEHSIFAGANVTPKFKEEDSLKLGGLAGVAYNLSQKQVEALIGLGLVNKSGASLYGTASTPFNSFSPKLGGAVGYSDVTKCENKTTTRQVQVGNGTLTGFPIYENRKTTSEVCK